MKEKTTPQQYKEIIDYCENIFKKKNQDYGTAWRILRLSSIIDQIYIKAQRIRFIQENNIQKITDTVESEFLSIINYSIIALIQLDYKEDKRMNIPFDELMKKYEVKRKNAFELMKKKNHDYEEAWRKMNVNSITDIILMKLLRIKHIGNNQGKTIVSENIDSSYQDIINYSAFALILLDFKENN